MFGCDNLYCRRCKRSEMVQSVRRLYLCSQCEEEEGTGENQDEPVGPRKMWQENWSLNMRGDVLDVEPYDVNVQEVGHVQTW